jgi:hypothetical protein
MDKVLKLPHGELAKLATHQRMEHLKRELGEEPTPLFGEVRTLILRRCHPGRERAVRAIFEQSPFGELERLVTRTILELVKGIARQQLENELWLRTVAKLSGRTYQEMRVVALEFLDTDIVSLSPENCIAFLQPAIQSWDIDLATFTLDIFLNPKISVDSARSFQFVERRTAGPESQGRGFAEFLEDRSLSGSATDEELAFLGALRITGREPTALYYYRELQNLRDPLHFRSPGTGTPAR